MVLHQQGVNRRKIVFLLIHPIRRIDPVFRLLVAPLLQQLLLLYRQGQADNEFRSLSRLCLHLNGASHQIDDILGDRHAKSCPLDAAYGGISLPFKRFKDVGGKFLVHADARIPDAKLIFAKPLPNGVVLPHNNENLPPLGSEFVGIGQQVQQHPVEPVFVTEYMCIPQAAVGYRKGNLLLTHLRGKHHAYIIQKRTKIYRHSLQLQLSTFNPAHFQDVVDQRQQILAGGFNLVKVFSDRCNVVAIAVCHIHIADNGIHRCADIMGHIGKKDGFG